MTSKEERNIQVEDKLVQCLVGSTFTIGIALLPFDIELLDIQKAQWNNITTAHDGSTFINVCFVVKEKK